ncbi:MAG: sulfurtransferase TusA family protein [Planctomycetota bacterium]|nr:sulfurtransferase TusA family protein [Planctomycetota bacterium]
MNKTLDCRAQQCPMPIVELSIAVRDMRPGECVVVEATDPAFELDVRAWAEMTGHLLQQLETGEVLRATILVR